MNSFQGSIAYAVLKVISAFIRLLPVGAVMFLGRRLGDFVFFTNAKNRRKAMINLRIAYGKTKTHRELTLIARRFFQAFGQNMLELPRLPLIAKEGFEEYVAIDGRDHLKTAMERGKGVIFLSMHSGNWELSNVVGSMCGYPYSMVANDLRHIDRVADFLNELRRSAGCNIINPGIGGREIIRRLAANEIVTLVADQGGKEGLSVPFLGRQASMSTGALRLALKYDVQIILVDIHRLGGPKHSLIIRPFNLARSGEFERDLHTNLKRMMGIYEQWINQHPHEYIWLYKTWKQSKGRAIVILDDGRTGHLRQSQAVARGLERQLASQSLEPVQETIKVEYKSNAHALVLALLTGGRFLFNDVSVGFLRFFLKPDIFERLACLKPDYVISTGAKSAPVNVCLTRDNKAKNITVLRPGLVPFCSFSKVILPAHDVRGNKSSNLILVQSLLTLY